MPHELRTPLTSILGYSQLLMARAGRLSAEQQAEMHRHIHVSAQRLSRTIGRYMAWSELNASRGGGQLRSSERVDAQGLTEVLASKSFRTLVLDSLPGEWASLPSNDRMQPGGDYHIDVRNHGPALPAQVHKVSGALIQFGRDQQEQQGAGLGLALCALLAQRNAAGVQWIRTDGAPNVVRLKLAARAAAQPQAGGTPDIETATSAPGRA